MIAALLCALPLLEFFFAPAVDVRRVSYRDRLTPSLAGYKSGARTLFRGELLVYPLGRSALPGVSDVGFYGSISRSLKTQTLTADGTLAFSTQEIAWDAGARYRGVFHGEELFAVSMGYGSIRNDFSGSRLPGVLLPSGTVQFWRPAVSGRLPFSLVALGAEAGYLLLARQDALGAPFPRSTGAGLDVGLSATATWRQFALRLSGRYTRIFYSLHPLPHDPYVAGGALDELFAVDLAFGLRL